MRRSVVSAGPLQDVLVVLAPKPDQESRFLPRPLSQQGHSNTEPEIHMATSTGALVLVDASSASLPSMELSRVCRFGDGDLQYRSDGGRDVLHTNLSSLERIPEQN